MGWWGHYSFFYSDHKSDLSLSPIFFKTLTVKYAMLSLFKDTIDWMDPILGELNQVCGARSQMNMELS